MQIEARDHSLYGYDEENDKEFRICNEIGVVAKRSQLGTYDTESTLRIWYGEKHVDFAVKRTLFTARSLQKFLLNKNVAVPDDKEVLESIVNYVLQTDEDTPTDYFHTTLGFTKINGKLVYLSANPIGNLYEDELQSTYVDMESLDPKGTFEAWRDIICKDVIGNIYLELALVIGASAPLVYLIRQAGLLEELPLVALIGKSTTGKSTAARLMASIEGSTRVGGKVLMNFNATENAFFKQLENRNGGAYLFDEITGKHDFSLARIVYSLVAGVEKAACASDRSLRPQATFAGTIVFTGERSLLDNVKVELGSLARVLELTMPWTKSGKYAEDLKEKLHANHGTAIRPLIEHLFEEIDADEDVFAKAIRAEKKAIKEIRPITHSIEERLYFLYALFVLTARVASAAWDIPFHADGIRDLLLEHHDANKPIVSKAEQLYELLVSKINENVSHFPHKKNGNCYRQVLTGKVLGQYSTDKGRPIVWITPKALQAFVGNEFGDAKQFFSELADKGLIKRDNNRHYTFAQNLLIGSIRCYGIYVDKTVGNTSIEEPSKKKKTNAMVNESRQRIIDLLADYDEDDGTNDVAEQESVAEAEVITANNIDNDLVTAEAEVVAS